MSYKEFQSFLRSLVVGVDRTVELQNGEYVPAINFDNAATTPPFHSVIQQIVDYAPWYSSIHRGKGYKSVLMTELYEEAREIVKQFVQADSRDVVIFTKSSTESINVLAYALAREDRQQVVLSTEMEHLANDLPWRDNFTLDYIRVDTYGRLLLDDLHSKLRTYQGKVRLVSVTGASNVTGHLNPIDEIARLAHQYGAEILVDGAQLVPHCAVDMKPSNSPEHIDYLVFSGHKMYAPFGTGVLIGPAKTFQSADPVYKGGGAVGLVSHEMINWDDLPAKYEAGTPNVMGALALVAAIKTLMDAGLERISQHEHCLIHYAIQGLKKIPDITLYGYCDDDDPRVSLLSFNLEGIYHDQLAEILSLEAGIAVRNGLFCAHPYVMKLMGCSAKKVAYYQTHEDAQIPGLVRISFGLYNNFCEIDTLLKILTHISRNKRSYKNKAKQFRQGDRCMAKRFLYC